jgi:hypothetical protein
MIPGISLSIRIVLVSQLEEELAGVVEEEASSVLEHLLDGHTEQKMFLQEKNRKWAIPTANDMADQDESQCSNRRWRRTLPLAHTSYLGC